MTFSHGVAGATLVTLGVANAAGLLQPLMMYVGIAMLAGVQTLAGPARSALLPIIVSRKISCQRYRPTRISERRRDWDRYCLLGLRSLRLTTVFLLGVNRSNRGMPTAFILPEVRLNRKAMNQAPGPANTGWVSLCLETSDFAGLFYSMRGYHSLVLEILPVLALGLFAGGAGVTGLGTKLIGPSWGIFASRLWAFARRALVLYASFAYGFILFGFGLTNSLWLGILMIALLGAAPVLSQ